MRRAFWGLGYAFFAVMLGTTLPTPLYPIYQRRYDLTELMITVIFATYAAAVIGSLILFGRLSDEIGRRPPLLAGVAASALSATVFIIAPGTSLLLVGRVLSGVSAGIYTGTATAAMVDLAAHDRARATAIAVGANLGGLGTGQLLAGFLAQYAPLPLQLPYVVDLVLLVPAAIALVATPETVRSPNPRWRVQRLTVPDEVRAPFLPAAVAGFCGFAVFAVYGSVMPVFVGTVLRQPNHALIGGLLFALLLASVAGQLVVRRLGRAAMPAGLACLSLGAVLLGLGVLLKSLVPIAASVPLLGVGQGLVVGWGLAAINQLAPADRRGEVASTYFTLLYVGLTIPVIGTGLAADAFGLQPAGVAFSAAVAVVVAAVGVALRTRLAAGAPTGSSPTRLPERSPARGAAARSPRRQI